MAIFKNVKSIFFDYDGTLHDSIHIYAPAFKKAYAYLVQNGLAKEKKWTYQEIAYWLGFNSKEMWDRFMPDLDESEKSICSTVIGSEMLTQMKSYQAVLYPHALNTLKYLKQKGYQLVFISNCRIYYRDMAREQFGLEDYFEEMVCSEEYDFIPKHAILNKIMNKYTSDKVIIGDRIQDIEAGKRNGIYTIGCTYGFNSGNELEEADVLIDDICDLKKYL